MENAKPIVTEDQAVTASTIEPNDNTNQDEITPPTAITRASYPAQILDGTTREDVEAVIVEGIDKAIAKDVDLQWMTATSVLLTELMTTNPSDYEKPEHAHWRWELKISFMEESEKEHLFLMLECQNEIQGMACITLGEACRISAQEGNALVYIEYISTAPWNNNSLLAKVGKTPRYRAVGPALITTIIEYSIKHGFSGRIGLHALPQATSFYSAVCGMTEFGFDANHEGLQYFEFTEEQAQAFLKGE